MSHRIERQVSEPPGSRIDRQPSFISRRSNRSVARKLQGFDISRIVHDYGLVCDVITAVAGEHGITASPREFQILTRTIDEAIATAIESFSREADSSARTEEAQHLGFLAHEIRNAVGNASVAFELIRRGKAGVNGSTAGVVQRALQRIAQLVAVALNEAKRSKAMVAQKQWIDLAKSLTQLVAETPTERGVRAKLEAEPDLAVDADEALLTSAMSNLLQNAIKFTRDQEQIVVRAYSTKGAIAIEVEDRCGGLPGGSSEDLFQPFVQRQGDRRGVGLGLPIARRAVEAHGGTLRVQDLPGVGCIFTILIPQTTRLRDSKRLRQTGTRTR
jgi:signal transduction histidine kinase